MTKPKKGVVLRQLSQELKRIQNVWNDIRAGYDEPDPQIDRGTIQWDEVTTVDFFLDQDDGATFAKAWAQAVIAARATFLADFSDWAAKVVRFVGVEKLPTECRDPPQGKLWTEGATLPSVITGFSDTLAAGLRLIFWAAAYRDPELCRRSSEYRIYVWQWIDNLVGFGGGNCWTYKAPLEWVQKAFEQLCGVGSASKKRHLTVQEANILVCERLKKGKIAMRALAIELECSPGLIAKTASWKAVAAHRKSSKRPVAVRFTREIEATTGKEDPALQQLIKEYEKDYEPSPLEPAGSRRGRRAQV